MLLTKKATIDGFWWSIEIEKKTEEIAVTLADLTDYRSVKR